MATILGELPKTYSDSAKTIVQQHLRRNTSGTNSPSSPMSCSSPKLLLSPQHGPTSLNHYTSKIIWLAHFYSVLSWTTLIRFEYGDSQFAQLKKKYVLRISCAVTNTHRVYAMSTSAHSQMLCAKDKHKHCAVEVHKIFKFKRVNYCPSYMRTYDHFKK